MFDILKEHRHRGKQIFLLAKTELLKTYKGALLGTGWAVVKPLFTLLVYWFAFEIGLRAGNQVGGVPRFVFMLTGFVPWFFMQDAILIGAKSIRANKQYVIKMAFPVSTIMTFTLISRMIVHFMLLVPMYIYLSFTGFPPSIYNLQFFIFCPLMFLFFLVVTWSTAPMAAFSKDFENLLNSVMTGIFWLSGIMWDANAIGGRFLPWVMKANPINFILEGYRDAFVYNRWIWSHEDGRISAIIFFAELIVFALLGIYNYKRLRKILPDVL